MRYLNILALICAFALSGMSQDYEVTVKGEVHYLDGSPAVELPIHFHDPSGPQTVAPIYFYTDSTGYYEYTYEVVNYSPDICGTLYMEACSDAVIEESICHSPTDTEFKFTHEVCYPESDCFYQLDYYLEDSGVYTVKVVGATDSDSIVWNTGETSYIIEGEVGKEYCVEVIDGEGCYFRGCIVIDEDHRCFFWIEGPPIVHPGAPTVLIVEPANNEPVSYEWSTGETTQAIEVTRGGEYCVEVTFIDGCVSSECIYVENIDGPECYGDIVFEDSMLTAILYDDIQAPVDNPDSVISYLWSTGETTASIIPTISGSYCVVISSGDCRSEVCYFYLAPGDCYLEVYCDPIEEGVILAAVGYGADSITYTWSTGSNDREIYVTEDGEYCVTMITGDGCTQSKCMDVKLDSIFQDRCEVFIEEFVDADGNRGLKALIRNRDNYVFTWPDGSTGEVWYPQETGSYCVIAFSEDSGCFAESCIYFLADGDCDVDVISDHDAGGVVIEAIPYGTAPFTYEWSTGSLEPVIFVTESGIYSLTITDATGCVAEWKNDIDVYGGDPCNIEITQEYLDDGTVLLTAHGEFMGRDSINILWSNGEVGRSIIVKESGSYCAAFDTGVACDFAICVDVRIENDRCAARIEVIARDSDTLLVAHVRGDGDYKIEWSTGEVTDTITYTEGEICLIVIYEDGCSLQRCIQLDNNKRDEFHIIGNLMDPVTDQIIIPRFLEVYSVQDDSTVHDVGYDYEVTDNGQFIIFLRNSGNYIVKAYAEEYIPTYYYSSATWQGAEIIHVGITTDAPFYNINMIPEDGNNGRGEVGGRVTSDSEANVGGDVPIRSGEGRPDIQILITDMEDNPLRVAFSDEEGVFLLDNLPFGKYRIHTEVAGVHSDIVEVELTPDNPSRIDLEFTIPGDLESADQTSSLNEVSPISSLKVYPNPIVDLLNIDFNVVGETGDGQLSMIDINGKVIHLENVSMSEGVNSFSLSIDSGLQNGIYMVVVKIGSSISTTRVLKY